MGNTVSPTVGAEEPSCEMASFFTLKTIKKPVFYCMFDTYCHYTHSFSTPFQFPHPSAHLFFPSHTLTPEIQLQGLGSTVCSSRSGWSAANKWLFRLHHTHCIRCRLLLQLGVAWLVYLSICVCLPIGYVHEPCKNGLTDQDAIGRLVSWSLMHPFSTNMAISETNHWEDYSCGPKEPCIRGPSRSDESIFCCNGWQYCNVTFR